MSKIVRINEGELARSFSGVQKLRTPMSGGGNCLWVPEDTVMLGTKSVNSGGVYNAENDGLYGYSQFSVNIGDVNSLCGIDTDGNYKWLRKINGTIYSSGLPTEIRVTTPPSKTSYTDGEVINYSGMVVKAYDENGNLWTSPEYPNGVVPNDELIFAQSVVDKKHMAFCWGNDYIFRHGYTFPPYAPIGSYYIDVGSEIKSYFGPGSGSFDYLTYKFSYSKPVFYVFLKIQDKNSTINIGEKERFIEQNEFYNGYYDEYDYGPLIICSEPFVASYKYTCYMKDGSIYRETDYETASSLRYVVVDKETNQISIWSKKPSDLERYSQVEEIHAVIGFRHFFYGWVQVKINNTITDLSENEYLHNDIINQFGSDNVYDAANVLGFMLLYGRNYNIGGIGWRRPGDGLLLTTNFPITVN